MEIQVAAISDTGIKKKVNQDAILVKVASSFWGRLALAAVCDGMGGLNEGELASATMVHELEEWFINVLPSLLERENREKVIKDSLMQVLLDTDKKLKEYTDTTGKAIGTTVSALLIIDCECYIVNVGDTRVYLHDGEKMFQKTHDHTYVQQEIDAGRMTEEQAEQSPNRSVLLQCVGAAAKPQPDFWKMKLYDPIVFLICSDGFRHVVQKCEIEKAMNFEKLGTERQMQETLKQLVKTIKKRKEEDNISAIILKVF
ncbi:MAG: serine/threonine-protein phosphatase [Lachnospiraceae bacterium]|nr:serine/threonine-protein phosphatase [Lachnospiraceae bacterium]